METFKLVDLNERLLPMVELIDDNDQAIELPGMFSTEAMAGNHFVNAAIASPSLVPTSMPTISPPMFESDESDIADASDLPGNALIDTPDENVELVSENWSGEESAELTEQVARFEEPGELDLPSDESSATFESNETFESDDEVEHAFDSDQFDDRSYDDEQDFDNYQENAPVNRGDRVPVSGPVAPRPLTAPVAHELNRGPLKPRPRSKKTGSPVMSFVKVIAGGVVAVPLAALILSFLGKPLDLGFWPFNGTPLTQIVAGTPMELSLPSGSRPNPQEIGSGRPLGDEMASNLPPVDEVPTSETETTTNPITDETTVADVSTAKPAEDILKELMTDVAPKNNLDDVVAESAVPDESTDPVVAMKPTTPDEAAFNDIVNAEPSSVKQPEPEPDPAPPLSVSFAPPPSPELVAAIELADKALSDVVNFEGTGDSKVKANLYLKLANLAMVPHRSDQEETTALIKRLEDAELVDDMDFGSKRWLAYKSRTDGFFVLGKLVQENDRWTLKWNGTELQLQNVPASGFDKKGTDVYLIGKIIDASPPAIVRVVYMTEQTK